MASNIREEADVAARLISDAGGEVVGRTRLQKIAYMLEAMGFGSGLHFEYKHYGPYSERLSSSVKFAEIYGLLQEDVRTAAWGGNYSIFRTVHQFDSPPAPHRRDIIALGNQSDPVELELAATAVLLAKEGVTSDPWAETETRKPEKAIGGRLDRAKSLFAKFKELDVNNTLPNIA